MAQAPRKPDPLAILAEHSERLRKLELLRIPASAFPMITEGTSFPSSPAEGDLHFYPLSGVTTSPAGGGVGHWEFRYNATTSKWDFAGGPALFAEVLTSQTTTSVSYADLATVGPSITVPLAGDYDVGIGANLTNDTVTAAAWMSYAVGGTAASDNDAITSGAAAAGDYAPQNSLARRRRKTGLAASTALVSKYRRDSAGGTVTAKNRWMSVIPVRVS